ncbi:MAG: hypothetical protein QME96_17400, partial [Myxococcota bacterium]|nr:hypothetical protein [Myxococcota bacterium]
GASGSPRLCLPPALGGVCAAACRPGDICSGSTSCVPFARDGDGDGRTESVAYGCAPWAPGARYPGMICSTDADCRSLLCRGGVCTVLCRDDSGCDPMTTCSPYPLPTDAGAASFLACTLTPVTDARIAEVSLPTQTIPSGAEGRLTRFWVPPGAVSLTVIARQRGAVGGYVGVLNAHDPAGERIYDYDDFAAGRDTPNWHIPDSRIGSLFIPISNRVTFRPGRYMYTPVFFPPDRTTVITDDIDFTALVKFDPGGAVAGRLSANFIFANPDAVNAATARTNARFQAALAEWQAIFGAAGITVSGFTYTDLPAAAAATYRVVDYGADIDTGEVGPLMAQSAGRTEWSVNVFFIHDFSGWGLLGIAGGVPGPSTVHGTTHSGVIVCLDCAWLVGGAFLGQVIAHEVGHYLGLFHSTENTGSTGYPYGGDPIADTREGDRSNLMYWEARGGRSLSAGQGWVIRRSPTVLPP